LSAQTLETGEVRNEERPDRHRHFFGEMALLGPGRRQATVTTTSPARVLVLFGEDFRRLQAAHPDIAAQLEAVMQKRLEQLS
jgi:CRP-like cAMP-binding protein